MKPHGAVAFALLAALPLTRPAVRLHAEGQDLHTFRVVQVLDGSPAAIAGVREGDVLAAVDGVVAKRYALDELYQMFKRAGRAYVLRISRGGHVFSVTITTKRLV